MPADWNILSALSISNNGLILAQAAFNGGSAQFVELSPIVAATSSVTVQTVPAGLQFSIDGGAAQIAPQTLTFTTGSTHILSVPTSQPGATGVQNAFTSWSDGGAASHAITVNGPMTFTASFQTLYQLTITAGTGGTVTPSGTSYFSSGSIVPINAAAGVGYAFKTWSGNVANANSASTTITMVGPETVMANFASTSTVTVQTTPAGLQFSIDGGVAQTAPQTLTLLTGSAHTLSVPTPQPGMAGTQYAFASWSDGGAPAHSITVNGAMTYTALFNAQYQLSTSASPPPGGNVLPVSGAYFDANSTVRISATPNSGYAFAGWSGAVADTGAASTTITLNSPQTVRANFVSTAPAITPGGVVPIFSSLPVIQPGSWISIYGHNLASGTTLWSGDFPTSLGGVSVTVDGRPGYLWLVSPSQINLQAPDDVTTGPVTVVVKTASGTASSTVTLAPFGPSFSLLDSKHAAGVIPTSDGSGVYDGVYDLLGPPGLFSFKTRPVKAGETLELFGVGFGPTNPMIQSGAVFSGAAPAVNPVTITIGGVTANVEFAGIASAGLYQFNVVVPDTGSGDQLLLATVAGVQTPGGVYVAVQ